MNSTGDTGWVRYVKVTSDGIGGSRFEEVEVGQAETPYADNTPPVFVSQTIPASALAWVTLPASVRETGWHPPPQRQFIVILQGEFELETTDGHKRLFQPGATLLMDDLDGQGHVTRVRTDGAATFMAIRIVHAPAGTREEVHHARS